MWYYDSILSILMPKTDHLERIHTMVRWIRQKKLSETEKLERIEKFFDRYFVKYKNQISFLMGNEVDIHDSISAHDAQHKAVQYLNSHKGVLPDTSTLEEEFVPLKIDATEIGSVHSDSIEAWVIQKYASDIMSILWSQWRKIDREQMELSFYDTLTGISNRAGLIRSANAMCHEDELVSVIWLDLDNFKVFNDAYGHPGGDDLLRIFAKRTSDFMEHRFWKRSDHNTWDYPLFGRYWWEEFLIILPWIDRIDATNVAKELVEWIYVETNTLKLLPIENNGWEAIKPPDYFSISAWVATHNPKECNKTELEKYIASNKSWWIAFQPFLWFINNQADSALTRSKFSNKNRATHYLDSVVIPTNTQKWLEYKNKKLALMRWKYDVEELIQIDEGMVAAHKNKNITPN